MINTFATFIGHLLITIVVTSIAGAILAFILAALILGILDVLGY